MILVDTSIWIDFLRGENSSERRMLHELIEDEQDVSITGIILTEILQGIKEDSLFHTTRDYLLEFPVYEPKSVGHLCQRCLDLWGMPEKGQDDQVNC